MPAIIYNEPLDKRSVYHKYWFFNFPPWWWITAMVGAKQDRGQAQLRGIVTLGATRTPCPACKHSHHTITSLFSSFKFQNSSWKKSKRYTPVWNRDLLKVIWEGTLWRQQWEAHHLRVVMSLYTQNGAKDDSVKKSTDIVCICQSSKYRTDLISSHITTFNNYSQSPWQSVTGQALIRTVTQLLEV
jgi:hypothetical protein